MSALAAGRRSLALLQGITHAGTGLRVLQRKPLSTEVLVDDSTID